jgi:polyisoprenoid-binding protein YceI
MARYRIIPERSKIWAEGRSTLHPIKVETTGLEGYLEANVVDGHVEFLQPPKANVELESERLKTGNGLYDRELERRLEVRKYPRVRGTVRSVTTTDSGSTYHVQGNLTLAGRSHTVEGDVTARIVDGATIAFEGEQVIDMRDFGLEPPKILMLRVYPDVKVRGLVVAQLEN